MVLLYLTLPMLVVLPLAFSDAQFLTFPPPGYSLRWFREYLGDRAWIEATLFSVMVAMVAGGAATALGGLVAFALVRAWKRGRDAIYLIFVSPLIVPHMVIAVALYFAMAPKDLVGTPLALIAAYTVLGLPYAVIVMSAGIRRLDPSLEHAAASLGGAPWRVALSIVIPLLRRTMATAFLFAFLAAFDDVVVALFLTGPETQTLPIRMWQDIKFEISPRIAAVSVLLIAIAAAFVGASSMGRLSRTALNGVMSGIERRGG